jgi:hypothetical protein
MEEISKSIDFTNLTHELDPGVHCFNPSIAHWKGDLYLCCYRAFVRYPNQRKIKEKLDPEVDPNHPWLGGDQSVTWWNTVVGGDGTGFFIMQISQPSYHVKNVKKLNDGKSIFSISSSSSTTATPPLQTNWTKLKGVDARLLHLNGDYFLLSYNIPIYSDEIKIKEHQTCSSGCFMIATRLIRLNSKTGELGVFQENIMCPSISNKIEKNWSFWVLQNQLFFSYGLAPKHQIYFANLNFENGIITCSNFKEEENNNGYFGELEKFYNLTEENKFLHVSVTTPAIVRRKKHSYIGVGHIKFKNKDQDALNLFQDTPLGKFYFSHPNLKHHPIYDYFMFLYEFDPITAQILSVSDAFLPEDTSFALSFPSGLEYAPSNGNLIISFGDHDSMCKLLIISELALNKMLKPLRNPQQFYFFMLPQTCYTKRAGVCSLLLSV